MPNMRVKTLRANIQITRVISSTLTLWDTVVNMHPFHLLIRKTPVFLSYGSIVSMINFDQARLPLH